MAEAFKLYRVLDPFVTEIACEPITDEVRRLGLLLQPSVAQWFLANGMVEEFTTSGPPAIIPPRPVSPKPLSEIFAPTLTPGDNAKSFILRALSGRLIVVEFDPEDYGGGSGEPADIGDMAAYFRNAII